MSTLASEGTTIKLEPDRCKCGSPFTGVVLETITSGDLLEPDENGFQEIERSAFHGYEEHCSLQSEERDDGEWIGAYCANCDSHTQVRVVDAENQLPAC